jgi:membrane fusion protein (multidrug efflux system)
VLDATTRTAPIEIEIPNGDYRLKPGMYARVSITTGNKKDALVVPSNAVVDFNGRRGVFIPSQTNTATFRPVRVGVEEDQRVEILEGLEEGDTIIGTGAAGLTDGGRFQVAGRNSGQGGGPAGQGGRSGGGAARNGQGRRNSGQGEEGDASFGAAPAASQGQRFGSGIAPAATDGAAGGERRQRRDGAGSGFGNGAGRRGGRRGGQGTAAQPPAGN